MQTIKIKKVLLKRPRKNSKDARPEDHHGFIYILGEKDGIICKRILLKNEGYGCPGKYGIRSEDISRKIDSLTKMKYRPFGMLWFGTEYYKDYSDIHLVRYFWANKEKDTPVIYNIPPKGEFRCGYLSEPDYNGYCSKVKKIKVSVK